MVITSGNCIVPLALWNGHSPSHAVSCILMTPGRQHLITGAADGPIIKWEIGPDWKMTPVCMMLGHDARVTNLCLAYEDEDRCYFVSATETGEMCLWDLHNGRCVLHKTTSRFIHTSIQSHVAAASNQPKELKGSTRLRLLFCCGKYPMLVVMEALSLTPLFHLSSRSNPTRFTALTVFPYPGQTTDVVLGLSANQAVTVWTVGAGDTWPSVGTAQDGGRAIAPPTQKFENESKTIKCEGGNIVSMCCCPTSPRTVLIVSQRTWQVHDAVDWCLLCSHSVEAEVEKARFEWTGGEFISLDTVLIHSSDGGARMYKLPVCAIAEQAKFRQMKESHSAHLMAVLDTNAGHPSPVANCGPTQHSNSSSLYSAEDGLMDTSRFAFFYEAPVLVRGDAQGRLIVWSDVSHVCDPNRRRTVDVVVRVPAHRSTNLDELWSSVQPRGLVDCLLPRDSSGVQTAVTASTFAQAPGKFAMGLASGDILVASILDCLAHVYFAAEDALGPPTHMRLSGGHSRGVSALCYPANRLKGSNSGSQGDYPPELLVSGGADFTIRLWDLNTGTHLVAFSGHGAPIMAIVSTPEQCSRRIQECVCCLAADHSVSLVNLRERKLQLMANLQPGPVSVIKWRPMEDFMLVGCNDGSLFVWETSSGHLDRFLPPGPTATAALNAGEHPYYVPARLYRRHGCSVDVPIAEVKGAPVGGGRMRIAGRSRVPVADLRPLKVQSVRGASASDQEWHILFFDTEALVAKLLSEIASKRPPEPDVRLSPRSRPRRQASPARPPRPAEPRSVSPRPGPALSRLRNLHPSPGDAEEAETGALELAMLLVSLLHAWDLDPGLDRACVSTLGLVKPRRSVHYASISHAGFLSLLMPTGFPHRPYWRLSSHLTTGALLAVVSLSNTLMQTMDGARLRHWPSLADRVAPGDETRPNSAPVPMLGGVKQSWSLVTAHHCVLLPELAPAEAYKRPRLEALARKWQDRCIEVRQAAQALLLSELRRIGPAGRQELLSRWSQFLPAFADAASTAPSNLERLRLSSAGSLDEELSALQLHAAPAAPEPVPRRPSLGNVSNGVGNYKSSFVEAHRVQALAVVMLGVIGAEFGAEEGQGRATALEGFGRDDYHLARRICKALIALVLPSQPSGQTGSGGGSGSGQHGSGGVAGSRSNMQGGSGAGGNHMGSGQASGAGASSQQIHSAMRRAAMDLFGRGFAVWEPYIDVTALLTSLLDYSLASASSTEEIENIIVSGGSLSPSADTARTARHALDLIASSRPRVFILTLSREVKRYNSVAANSQLAGSAAPTAMAIYAARHIILRGLETLCEKRASEVAEVLGEVVEVLLHCLDYADLKEWSLRELFPQIARFPSVSSSPKTQKIAVGTRTGALFLYDFKQGKFNSMPTAHSGQISCLSFHTNGKHIASFSTADGILRVWQLGTANLFGMVGTQLRCVTQRPLHATKAGENVSAPDMRGTVFVEWLDNRSVALYSAAGMLDKMRVL